VHGLEHHGFANVHYIAAAAAMSLHDFNAAQAQLQSFLSEDPANPLSPVARQRLEALANGKVASSKENSPPNIEELPASNELQMTFPNSDYLAAQLKNVFDYRNTDECETCGESGETVQSHTEGKMRESTRGAPTFTSWEKLFTIHQAVDETALFFSVTHRGHAVNDLSLSDIQVRDDNKAPEKILQFIPQSKLPLRLGLLIDTSDSVKHRVNFERKAAKKFLEKVLTNDTDLAFVEGFQSEVSVTQDFTRDEGKLAQGIDMLKTGGDGTALFDAVFFACWKLSAYSDEGRSAKVLVVLTDGEDNSSHRSLKQAIEQADATGVTVYTISTADKADEDTDANRILKTTAQRTGGQSIFPRDLHALDYHLNELPRAIRSRYLIAYKAANFKPDGRFRTIRVTAAKNGDQLRVQVRKGYFARSGLTRY
jgi:Ca-activated chloride channel family protein